MKYFKCITDFDYVTKDFFNNPLVEISRDEFLQCCENLGSYSLCHCTKDGEKVHLICIAKYIS